MDWLAVIIRKVIHRVSVSNGALRESSIIDLEKNVGVFIVLYNRLKE